MASMDLGLIINGVVFDGKADEYDESVEISVKHGPVPSYYQVDLQDVDYESGRTADGVMHREAIRTGATTARKIELKFAPCDTATVSRILQTVGAHQFVPVTYLDPYEGGLRENKNFYVGDRTAPVYRASLGLWDSVSFDLVEQ